MNEFNQVRFDFDFLHATKKHKLETAHLLQMLTEPTAKEAHKIRLYYMTLPVRNSTSFAKGIKSMSARILVKTADEEIDLKVDSFQYEIGMINFDLGNVDNWPILRRIQNTAGLHDFILEIEEKNLHVSGKGNFVVMRVTWFEDETLDVSCRINIWHELGDQL